MPFFSDSFPVRASKVTSAIPKNSVVEHTGFVSIVPGKDMVAIEPIYRLPERVDDGVLTAPDMVIVLPMPCLGIDELVCCCIGPYVRRYELGVLMVSSATSVTHRPLHPN